MADVKNNLVVSDMRDYALITLMKTIRRMELLDEKRNNEAEVAKIRRYIGSFVHKAFNGNVDAQKADALFEKFPEIMEIYEEKDDTKAIALTKELMQKWKKALLNQVTEYKKISENDCDTVILNAEKVYDEVFKPYIETHNKARRNKDNQIDRKEFIQSLISGDMNENVERIVLSAKESVLKKISERKNDKTRKSLFADEINSLVPGIDVSYSVSRNSEAVKQANKKVRSYFSAADAKKYRTDYPKDYMARQATSASKEDFLKLLGSMAAAGYSQINLGIKPSDESFKTFSDIMKKSYPQNTDEIINKSLGIAKNADREAQFTAFADKSASVYTQMLGGFIQLRADTFPNETINSHIIGSLKKYIDGMQNGVQDIHAMSMLMPEKDNESESVKKQLSQEQHVNIDHKIPVASAITTYIRLHPELGGNLDPNKLQLSQLLELAVKAAPLVDNIGNHRQVISKSLNNLLEPDGEFNLGKKKDNSILAVRYNYNKIQDDIAKMPGLNENAKARYQDAFAKYSKADKRGVITTSLALPEDEILANARKENSSDKDILDVRVLTENALTIRK